MNEIEFSRLLEFLMRLPFWQQLSLYYALINREMRKTEGAWNEKLGTTDLVYSMGFSILLIDNRDGTKKNILGYPNFESTPELEVVTEATIMGPPDLIIENNELDEKINKYLDIKSAQLILGGLVVMQLDEEIVSENQKNNDSLWVVLEDTKKHKLEISDLLNDTEIFINQVFSITSPALKRMLEINVNPKLLELSFSFPPVPPLPRKSTFSPN